MPVYVEIMLIQDHIEDNPNMDFTGFKNDNQIVKLPKLYGQTYRTFGHKEAALKRLLWFIKREYENQEHYVDEETFVLKTIDNIGSNEYTCYLCYNETHPLEYCFDTNMTLSYQGIAQDIALVATDISIECLHENCTMMCITVYLPVDISSIRVGQMINYATFEHLETECALEMETLNNGAGIGKELFSFDRTQFDLKEDVVFMFCTTIKNTCSYKRIN
jgi:hypothetical protein